MKTISGILIGLSLAASAAPASAQDRDWTRDLDHIADYAIAMAADALGQVADARGQRREADRAREAAERAREAARRTNRRGEQYTEQFTRTARLGRNGRFELSNLSGDVEITGTGGDDVKIVATKVVYAPTEAMARQALRDTTIEVTERPGLVAVKAEPMRGRSEMPDVNYVITLPAGTSIGIETLSGDLRVKNVDGEVRLQSLSGDVTLTDSKSRGIDVESVSGDVRLGQIESDRVRVNSISGDLEYAGKLAKAGHYELRTNSGDIRIITDGGAAFDLEAQTFSGDVTSDFAMKLRGAAPAALPKAFGGSRLPRNNEIRGTVNDGGALLSVRSFSGDITLTSSKPAGR